MALNSKDAPSHVPSPDPVQTFLNDALSAAGENASGSTGNDQVRDPFWVHADIDGARWNKVFPYRFVLLKRDASGKYIEDGVSRQWVFNLPFPPESLSISMPFAITGSVTQGGYIEEHGGAPVRMIQLTGTTGVLPLRGAAPTRKDQNLGQAIFAGTIAQANRVAASSRTLATGATGAPLVNPNVVDPTVFESPANSDTFGLVKGTGYYQFRLLQKFFEDYVAFKQTLRGRDYRLAFCVFKQQSIYLVTPVNYTASQSSDSPLEYRYNLTLRAWRRVNVDSVDASAQNVYQPAATSPNALQRVLDSVLAARDVLENARDVVSAVAGDIEHLLFEPLRQVTLFAKDALSVPLAFADLPSQVLNACQDSVIQFVGTQQALLGVSDTIRSQDPVARAYRALANLAQTTSKIQTGSGIFGGAASLSKTSHQTDPAFSILRNPHDHYDLFSKLRPVDVQLPPTTTRAIATQRVAARQLKRLDFERMRDSVMGVLADFEDAVGAGNATFDKTFNRTPRATAKTPTPGDFRIIFALNKAAMALNGLAASGVIDKRLRSVDFVAGLASQSGIAFNTPRSKFAVPFPYGFTMEELAFRYLGDRDRWIEIAALNGLRAPYVDEEGFDLPLVTNGEGNQVIVADASNLAIGQQVWLSAALAARGVFHVTAIDETAPGTVVLTLDVDLSQDNLSRYTTAEGAVLHAFLPDTVNSQMAIYIPSDLPPATDDFQMKDVPGLDVFDELLNAGGFDLLLTEQGDLAITPDGDCRLAVGLANIVQTVRTRLSVPRGDLPRHPEFGLPLKVGQSVADLSAAEILKAAQNLFIDDPSFTGVQSASVRINGPVAALNISVGVRGQSQAIPITLNFKK